LYDSLNLVVSGVQLWDVGRKEAVNFAL